MNIKSYMIEQLNTKLFFFLSLIVGFAFYNFFLFFIFLIFCLALLIFQMYKYNIKLFFFNIFNLNHLSNIFIIGFGTLILLKYRFYNEIILIILILSMLLEFFPSKNVKKSNMLDVLLKN